MSSRMGFKSDPRRAKEQRSLEFWATACLSTVRSPMQMLAGYLSAGYFRGYGHGLRGSVLPLGYVALSGKRGK
eukprot:4287835-Pleurochrysis_carterae.AAC.1